MAISIRAAFKNVLSERYNKTNAAYYIALVLIAIISYICSASFSEKEISDKYFFPYVVVIVL